MAGFKSMSAKFTGQCTVCGYRIDVGDAILWKKHEGAKHADCGAGVQDDFRASGYCEDFPCCGHEAGDCFGQKYGSDASIKARVYARSYDEDHDDDYERW